MIKDSAMNWINLGLGSVAGGFARYFVTTFFHRALGGQFPFGTMAVNLSGCLLIGILNGLAQGRLALSPEARVLLMAGFCGAFTTFSTFILETMQLAKGGEPLRALGNVAASVCLGAILFLLGEAAGRLF